MLSFYGIQTYIGLLWLNILYVIVTLSIYFMFAFVAIFTERYYNGKEAIEKMEREKEDLAERVAKKINFSVK